MVLVRSVLQTGSVREGPYSTDAETLVTLHVRDLVHGFRAVRSTTPQWISGLNSRSEAPQEKKESE